MYELSFCCHGFLLHWYSWLLCLYCIFTPARVKKQSHSPDHLDAPNPLLSWLSHVACPDSALALCRFLYKSRFTPRPGRAPCSWGARRTTGMLLKSVFRHWSISLHPSPASPCSHLTARQTLPTPPPSSSPGDEAKSEVVELKTSRDWVQCLVPLHYISFLRLPRGFWGEAEKIQWITWAMPGSRGLASRPILHKYVYISQGWDDTGL